VFISSTREDLASFREAARDAALFAACQPLMMEYFGASGQPPLAECLGRVAEADVVIVIVAHRYGWVPPDQPDGSRKSVTWLECLEAFEAGKEVLAFLVPDSANWPVELKESYRATVAIEHAELTPELMSEIQHNITNLSDFRKWLQQHLVVSYINNRDELRANVGTALQTWRHRQPAFRQSVRALGDPFRYLQALQELTAWIDVRGLQVGSGKAHRFLLEALYVPLKTTTMPLGPSGGGTADVPDTVDLEKALASATLVIIGDPGSGKTTFLRYVAHVLAASSLGNIESSLIPGTHERHFPVLLRLAELADHIRSRMEQREPGSPSTPESPAWIPHFLAAQSLEWKWGLDRAFFDAQFESESTVVLIDGLDEAPTRQEREGLARLFENATQMFQHCRFVVSTRPQSYEGRGTLAGYDVVRLRGLDDDAVQKFIRKWCEGLFPLDEDAAQKHHTELAAALDSRVDIRRMARNPVMLTALAVVHWNERRLPEQRADLYESILTWLSRARERRLGRLSSDRCLTLLQELALAMQEHRSGRQVQVTGRWAAEQLSAKLEPIGALGRAQAFLEEEEVDSGIIVSRGSDVRFWHLTFQEFLAARQVAGLPDKDQYCLLTQGQKLYRAEWREVLLLLAGILRVRQGAGKVDALLSRLFDDLGSSPTLVEQVRCAGLVGAMVRDLEALDYKPSDSARYSAVLRAALEVFDPKHAKEIPFAVRLEAAEALGKGGDPRLSGQTWANIDGLFEIRRYLITVQEFAQFIEDDGYQAKRLWVQGGYRQWSAPKDWETQIQYLNRPVTGVSWYEASAYATWRHARLPTHLEWERTALACGRRKYPWGDGRADHFLANYGNAVSHPTPVGLYPLGATPQGVHDLAGNVWEWLQKSGPGVTYSQVRGGSFLNLGPEMNISMADLDKRSEACGFRCARNLQPGAPII
jgi:hypothetical protein